MKICIDVQAAIGQRAGVGRYTQRLVQSLDALAPADELRLFYFDFKRRGLPFPVRHAALRAARWAPGRVVQGLWKTLGWPPFDLLAGPADVYHFPNFILPPLRRGRSVVTIHDMSFLRFPEFAEARNQAYLSARIRDTVARADRIVTDSRFSAAEIAELMDLPADRVTPIYPGISEDFARPPDDAVRALRARLGLDRPYLLTVGTIEPRKNLGFLVDVFEAMTDFDGRLVLAGVPGWKTEPIVDRIRRSPRAADILLPGGVPDEDLPALYAGAELFVIASHYEGFGFPPLEAMACGTPVLSSNGGSLAEVVGPGGERLDAGDAEAWAAAAQCLLTNTALRADCIARGRRRAAEFAWSETARQTLEVYRSLASQPDSAAGSA